MLTHWQESPAETREPELKLLVEDVESCMMTGWRLVQGAIMDELRGLKQSVALIERRTQHLSSRKIINSAQGRVDELMDLDVAQHEGGQAHKDDSVGRPSGKWPEGAEERQRYAQVSQEHPGALGYDSSDDHDDGPDAWEQARGLEKQYEDWKNSIDLHSRSGPEALEGITGRELESWAPNTSPTYRADSAEPSPTGGQQKGPSVAGTAAVRRARSLPPEAAGIRTRDKFEHMAVLAIQTSSHDWEKVKKEKKEGFNERNGARADASVTRSSSRRSTSNAWQDVEGERGRQDIQGQGGLHNRTDATPRRSARIRSVCVCV